MSGRRRREVAAVNREEGHRGAHGLIRSNRPHLPLPSGRNTVCYSPGVMLTITGHADVRIECLIAYINQSPQSEAHTMSVTLEIDDAPAALRSYSSTKHIRFLK